MKRALALVIAFGSLLAGTGTPIAATRFDPFKAATIDSAAGARVPLDRAFRDETGKLVTLRELAHDLPILLAPVLYNCPNICGVTLGALSDAVAGQILLPGRDFALVAFGIDPKETSADARASLAAVAARDPSATGSAPFHALTGRPEDVAAVTDALGYRYAFDPALGQYDHVAAIAVLTPDGHLARWLPGIATDAKALREALLEAGENRIGNLADRLLMLCYHYDPQTGRYSLAVNRVLQAAGVLTILALAGFLGAALLRERRRIRTLP